MMFRFALPLLALVVAGCSTFEPHEIARIRAAGAPPPVVAKMERGDPLTPPELIGLARSGVPDSYTLRHVEDAGVDYLVTPNDAARLRRGGVSGRVIDALLVESDRFASDYAAPAHDVSVGVSLFDPYPLGGDFYLGHGW